MAHTFADIQLQIQKLQEQADVLKKKEAVGVIDRIKVAIDAYGLTPEDLFGAVPAKSRKQSAEKGVALVPTKKTRRPRGSVVKKPAAAAKFTDGTQSWSGHGKRPRWFKEAIEAGKTPEDLAVKAS